MRIFRWRIGTLLVAVVIFALLLVVVLQQKRIDRQHRQIQNLRFRLEIEVRNLEMNGIRRSPIKEEDLPPLSSQARAVMEQQINIDAQ